jgi:hypothetical protein
MVSFDLKEGWVEVDGKKSVIRPLSPKMQEILAYGGLVNYWRSHG